jgi:hypothetical protein
VIFDDDDEEENLAYEDWLFREGLIEADRIAGDPNAPLEEREKAWEYLQRHGYS